MGIINYLGYFRGAPIPPLALHDVGLAHIIFGCLLWVFVVGDAGMMFVHWFVERPQ